LPVEVAFTPPGMPSGDASTFTTENWSGISIQHNWLDHRPILPAEPIYHSVACAVEDGAASASNEGMKAVAKRSIGAGETAVIRFVFAWYQPNLKDNSAKHYRHAYGKRFANAQEIATYAISKRTDWLRRILAWQEVIYSRTELPEWLREALVNGLCPMAKNAIWLAKFHHDDWYDDIGLFVQNESFSTCSLLETMPCRFFGHWPAMFFFPELERSTLHAIRHFQLRDGETPFCFGLGFALRDPRYECQHTCGPGEYAQIIYRNYLCSGDEEFLKEFYPSARDAINWSKTLDYDNDGLVNDHVHAAPGELFPANNPFDQWPWFGTSSYVAGKWLATLMAGIEMAEVVGDEKQAEDWKRWLERGQASYEDKLWNGSYYRLYNDPESGRISEISLSAQLNGVWATKVIGLPDPLPKERIHSALDAIARLNFPASPYGMVNGVHPDGTIETTKGGSGDFARDIFVQCNWGTAMTFIFEGRREEGNNAARKIADTIFRGPDPMPWSWPCSINSTNGSSGHGHDYYDAMVIWSFPMAFAGTNVSGIIAPGRIVDDVLKAANP